MLGGYRPGSGRSKSGYYKGIYSGSTYELCWMIYSIDHKIVFNRFPGLLEKEGLKYFPDFLLGDNKTIIELKGYEAAESVDKKTKLAEELGYIVKVLRKNDLKEIFEYVSKTYKTKKFYELYDGYKPKYNYVCSECKKEFAKEKKLKTALIFCDRICAGKGRFRTNKEEGNFKNEGKANKGTFGNGINGTSKFTKEIALEIFNHKKENMSLRELGLLYGVSANVVWFIRTRRTYQWIHEDNE